MIGDVLKYAPVCGIKVGPRSRISAPIFILLIVVVSSHAYPRDLDGRLGPILSPNNARPALVLKGGSFEVQARSRVELQLTSDAAPLPIETIWVRLPNGIFQGTSKLPPDVAPGTYALETNTKDFEDTNRRSVYVYEEFPETYRIAHLSNLRAGAESGRDENVLRSITAINVSKAAIVLITGDLTDGGTPEQFVRALDLLNECGAPTFVCPGPAEIVSERALEYLGPTPFAFRFGPDGYLGHFTAESSGWDPTGASGRLHRLRRLIRSARWSVGFTNRYDPHGNVRDHLVLFRDDPLDFLICALQAEGRTGEFEIPWGGAIGYAADGARRGAVQLFEVDSSGVALVDVSTSE